MDILYNMIDLCRLYYCNNIAIIMRLKKRDIINYYNLQYY